MLKLGCPQEPFLFFYLKMVETIPINQIFMESTNNLIMDKLETENDRFDIKFRVLMITLAAFATGVAWRIRGDGPFGGMLGMLVPAILLTLLILYVFGHYKKISSAEIGILIISMAITAAGWGTINGQITGILTHEELPDMSTQIMLNPIRGCFAIFVIGFGWLPLWSATIGRYFSGKKYESKEFLKRIIIYYATKMFGLVFLAHLIMPLVAPEAFDLFIRGLDAEGHDMIPYIAYMTHFKDNDWLEEIPGGRNYGSMINNLSQCLGTLALYLYIRLKNKDKKAAKIHIMICLIFGISILVADLWQFWSRGGLWGTQFTAPDWLAGWSMWEYTTGFLGGGLTMWYLFRQKPPTAEKSETKVENMQKGHDHFIDEKWIPFWRYCATWVFICVFSWVNALGGELNRTYEIDPPLILQVFGLEVEVTMRVICFLIAIVFGFPLTALLWNKKIKLPDWSLKKWLIVDLLIFLHIFCMIYFWAASLPIFIAYISSVLNILMLTSYIITLILIIIVYLKYPQHLT